MSNCGPISEGQHGTKTTLSALVEKAAVQMVMGNINPDERIALLKSICEQAELDGRPELARCIMDALEAASHPMEQVASDILFSDCIQRIQRLLTCTVAESSSCQTSCNAELSAPLPLGEDRELLGEFILESRDHLAQIEMQMMTLERDPTDAEAINTVFRGFHTIKGLAGFLGLDDVRAVAHDTETLLDLARNRRLVISPAIVDLVLASEDFLKAALLRLEQTLAGTEVGPVPEKDPLLGRIQQACSSLTESPSSSVEPSRNTGAISEPAEPPAVVTTDWAGSERRVGEDRRAQASDIHFVKVDTAKLDYLVDMAGEMVIAESMVRHHPELATLHSPEVVHRLAQLTRITSDLQKTAMSMRMVPIGGLFQKMNRFVRDLARKTGKRAELETIGADTELDRNVVEELSDPLMHMVRNAVDHGLETAEERLMAGKDPVGRIHLRAFHQAGHIVIEIGDDGRGLDADKIMDKARRMGLVDHVSGLTESEIFELIFHPGFSTAEKITDVSGRGVGMDVVKKRIQKLRGQVVIESNPGRGTSFFLRMPLTLAIIDGLVVGVGRERYIIPIFSVREMLRPSEGMIFTVEDRQEMALVRNSLLPVVRLYKRFGVQPRSENSTESLLIVAEAAGRSFCLMVDELIGKQEVVIKTLGETIKDIPGIAGGAILGDGRVGLILDLEGIFRGASK